MINRKVNYSNLHIFICPSFAYILSYERSEIDPKPKKCIFLKYTNGVKGYKLWDLVVNKIMINKNVIFDENHIHLHMQQQEDVN